MSNQTISEFLEARIAEDEALAQGASEGRFSWASVDYNAANCEAHGYRWAPARVLAECAAKRFILTMHDTYVQVASERTGIAAFGAECGRDVTSDVLKPLAAVYKDNPDYQKEWAL